MSEKSFFAEESSGLFTDLYQLTMAQSYVRQEMTEEATFSLFFRELPETRNYLVACGIEPAVEFLESVRFSEADIDYLRSREMFTPEFLEWLGDFRFEGDVYAMPEGTPVFPDEPLVEVVAPIAQAQIAETVILNQIHFQTILAAKAARVATAAEDATVLDFGARRIYGSDAAMKACRAYHIGGLTGTSLVQAGKDYGVPISGTMAHSYIQAHDDEFEAFREFARDFPETILLVDTYDTLSGVEKVVELAEELGDDFRVTGIRLDSGDLGELARKSREILDDAGLTDVQIVASGGLDEYEIQRLLDDGAPIDGFGVGTNMAVSEDAPKLDMAYKLVSYAGKGRMKLSTGKATLPGRKQVFRICDPDGGAVRDIIGRSDEDAPENGAPLLQKVMEKGELIENSLASLDEAREWAKKSIDALPTRIQALNKAEPPYPVEMSSALESFLEKVESRVEEKEGGSE